MLEITVVFPQSEGYMLEHPPAAFPYGRIRIADYVIKGPRDALNTTLTMEVAFLRGELAREFPGMDFSKVRAEGSAWWFGEHDIEVQRPLDAIDHAVIETVRWRLAES
jgi:hypothetical protein